MNNNFRPIFKPVNTRVLSPAAAYDLSRGFTRPIRVFGKYFLSPLVLFANAITSSTVNRTRGLKIHPQQAQTTIHSLRYCILLHQLIRARLRRTNGQGIHVQFLWAAIRGYLRRPFEMVLWSSQCDQNNCSPALPLPLSIGFLPLRHHLPVYASGSKSYWLGSNDGRGCTTKISYSH